MTARETTLGALTAADLGKRVDCGGRSGVLSRLMSTGRTVAGYARDGRIVALGRLDTPVAVYDEEDTDD